MPAPSEPVVHLDEDTTKALQSTLSSLEPEVQRGRKRRRSPLPFALVTTTQTPSGESSTFRGRRRYRSTSLVNMASRNAPTSFRDISYSPSKKRHLQLIKLERRRSQSPSRSRSPFGFGQQEAPKRRLQRTRSRSRSHKNASLATLDLKSPLQFEVVSTPAEDTEPDKD